MVKRFDHVTFVVHDVEEARHFLGLLGFAEDKSAVIISGEGQEPYIAAFIKPLEWLGGAPETTPGNVQ